VADTLLRIQGLTKRFGGVTATDLLSLDIRRGELHALIGPNGAGKSTLIAQMMGEIAPDSGTIVLEERTLDGLSTPRRVRRGLGRTFQITQLLSQSTALENVAIAVQAHRGHSFRFGRDPRNSTSLRAEAQRLLDELGLGECADVPVAHLAHGEQKQLELAIALAGQPTLLLLDEPLAGLGPAESTRMIEILRTLKGRITMLLVEHDMDDRISVLVYGHIIASGNAAEIRANADVRTAYLGDGDA
jgi:branched-chain amino acid transport system ATP-binding protein